jgi:oxygen-dependent protoporphyrinogen oxidase
VNLVYERPAVGAALEGHGFFVPRSEKLPLLACSFVSVKFPERVPSDRVLLRAFLGGARDPALPAADPDLLVRRAHDVLAPILGLRDTPILARAHRFAQAMPQFPVGFGTTIAMMRARAAALPGLFLCGAAVGAFGIPDAVAEAERAAKDVLAFAARAQTRISLAGSTA